DRADTAQENYCTAETECRHSPLHPTVTRASASGLASPDAVEALLDVGEAVLDRGLEFVIGENIAPVIFDAFAHQFADIERIDTFGDPLPDEFDARSFRQSFLDRAGKPLRDVAP